jgi:preprotein translocase subunit SecA
MVLTLCTIPTTIPATVDDLELLAQEINSQEKAFARNNLMHAQKQGNLLLQAKKRVKQSSHSWTQWLKASCPAIAPRTARLYMQIDKHWDTHLAEMATVANFSIHDAQKLLNNLSHHKKPPVPQRDNLATLNRTLQLAVENLDQFQQENWDLCDQEVLNQLLNTIATLEKRAAQARNQLSYHLRNQADCCPYCGTAFLVGMESCLNCGWNTVQLALQNYT